MTGPGSRADESIYRWRQVVVTFVCMAAVANVHYGWSLFVYPLDDKYQWGRAEIQVAFTLFVLALTWLMPVAGYLADRLGARQMIMAGGVLVAIAWSINAFAGSLMVLYVAAVIGGTGTGIVYSACIGHSLKCFSDQRGFAVGLTAAGFGTMAAATVLPIYAVIQAHGYENAFLYFGLGQGALVLIAANFLSWPLANPVAQNPPVELRLVRNYGPFEVMQQPAFWLMYAMFFLVALAGVMAIAQLAPIAKEYKIANVPVSILDLTLPALAFALAIDRVFSGLTRPFFGWVSDRCGRERTLGIAFAIEAAAIVALPQCGHDPLWFVLITAVIFFCWGEIYSLFPATCADTFGTRYASTHAALLYTAKGAAALVLISFSEVLIPTNDWQVVFYSAAGMNAAAALLALLPLRPLRVRQFTRDRVPLN